MSGSNKNKPEVHTIDDDDECAPDEYIVEVIRNKRRNPKTGGVEYFIKWENYPENENTWEPIDNLSCPEKIVEYEEKEKAKRKRRGTKESDEGSPSVKRRYRKEASIDGKKLSETPEEDSLIIENGSDTDTLSSLDSARVKKNKIKNNKSAVEDEQPIPQPRGFKRNLAIEKIVGSCTDDKEKLWFFIKWKGLGELELVEVDDIESHAPKQLCAWYRERLYQSIRMHDENKGL